MTGQTPPMVRLAAAVRAYARADEARGDARAEMEAAARDAWLEGASVSELAAATGFSPSWVHEIVTRRRERRREPA